MTEEQANELLKVLEEMNQSSEEFANQFDKTIELFIIECRRSVAEKFVTYTHKAVSSTFITRWYWMRKAKKCCVTLKEICDISKELGYVKKQNKVIEKEDEKE